MSDGDEEIWTPRLIDNDSLYVNRPPRGPRCESTDPSIYPWATERRCELAHNHEGYHTRLAGDGKSRMTWSIGGLPMSAKR